MSLDFFMGHTITIEAPTTTQDASGGSLRTWAPIQDGRRIPASVQPLPPQERYKLGQRQVYATDRIYTSFDPQVKRDYRILDVDTGQIFVVVSTANVAGWYGLWNTLVWEQVDA